MAEPHYKHDFSRRGFLVGLGAALGVGLVGDGYAIEPHRVVVSRHDFMVPGLSPALDGLTIAQVADVHLPANRRALERTLDMLRSERPDIVVLTGDQCETSSAAAELVEFARAARGRMATVAVLGNWDYRGGLAGRVALAAYERAGVTLLVNGHHVVRVNDAFLAFVGFDDMLTGAPSRTAAGAVAPGIPAIWLVHEPGFADQPVVFGPERPILTLAGHTHGGQIRIPGLPAFTPPGSGRFVAGWYRALPGRMYVSRGIGTADIRARLFCPPELPIFTLRSGDTRAGGPMSVAAGSRDGA